MNKINIKNSDWKAHIHRFANKFGKQEKQAAIKQNCSLGLVKVGMIYNMYWATKVQIMTLNKIIIIQVDLTTKISSDTSLT